MFNRPRRLAILAIILVLVSIGACTLIMGSGRFSMAPAGPPGEVFVE